jgi:hypothetical protein
VSDDHPHALALRKSDSSLAASSRVRAGLVARGVRDAILLTATGAFVPILKKTTPADIGRLSKAIHPGSYDHVDDHELGTAGLAKHGGDVKKLSKQLIDGMTVYSLPHFVKVWLETPEYVKEELFGRVHVKELDLFLRAMQEAKTDHLPDNEIGNALCNFIDGHEPLDPVVARFLFTPSGTQMMTQVLTFGQSIGAISSGNPGTGPP